MFILVIFLFFSVALAKRKGVLDDYYETRLKVIDWYHKLSKKIAKLRLKGISAWRPKDYKLMYAIQNGNLIPPDLNIHSLMTPLGYPGVGNPGKQRAKQRGIFNPKYLFQVVRDQYGAVGEAKNFKEDPFTHFGQLRNDDTHTMLPDFMSWPQRFEEAPPAKMDAI